MQRPPSPIVEDEASLYSLASEYFEAAQILARTLPTKFNVSTVTRYLLGHSAELLLKSLLYKHGVPLEELKNRKTYGHNLSKLVARTKKMGLVDSQALLTIVEFSKTYSPKHTEYRQMVPMQFPSLELLLQDVRCLQGLVFNHVAHFTSGA